jgi:putative transposase
MRYNPYADHRRSPRLSQYDYSQNGAYFITICASNRESLFGHIIDEQLVLNESGRFSQEQWLKIADLRQNVTLDKFIVMPNHIHGIIILDSLHRGTARRAPTESMRRAPTQGFDNPR